MKNEFNLREDLMWTHDTLNNVSSNQCKYFFIYFSKAKTFSIKLRLFLSDKLSKIGL